ncbi:SDR family oxidoreductase [Azospirillum sp. TSO22-1]|uniref:SDR family oxidoreductase n=1 Tax=Azospirillum sp. TSO22-1 TaxID=716789 RepID=UPI000D604E9E|nr:SDR family oxidoreductase [Azospirillum sp. TSO22-1]PWC56730.1 epimerase [Azospirillum sp. TSO22-1]
MTAPRLFVFGLGYTAGVLARQLAAEGWRIAGTCQTAEKRAELEALGYEAHVFDREHPLPDARAVLKDATHLLLSIPPDRKGDPVLAAHGQDIADLISLEWAGYLSTTGVYGDSGGEWVSEASWLRPTSDRSRRRVEAEKGWLNLYRQYGVPLHVFRLPGIYGPGRSAIDQLRAGEAKRIDKPGHLFGRIHVEDIAGVLRASMATMNPGAVYNVCDDEPAEPQEVIRYAAELLGVEPPPLVPYDKAELSEMARSFWADNRRVKNERIKTKLGYALKHPSYRDGLKAQAEAG